MGRIAHAKGWSGSRIWDPNYSGVLPGVHCGGMKPRAHFKHTIDKLDGAGEIIEQLAGVHDYELAEAPWLAAVERWPGEPIILRQGARVVRDSRRPRVVK